MDTQLTINEVATCTGLSAHTLRYYERAGLIAPVARAPGGQRRYAASDMEWIGFLLRLRATHMPIGQMQVFARLRGEGNATAPERRQMLETHLADVQASIKLMQQSVKVLQAKIEHYHGLERSLPQVSKPDKGKSHASKPLRTRSRKTA
ncbi:MAG: MerR family transcriptional regulator [Pseudomonadota bacterium]